VEGRVVARLALLALALGGCSLLVSVDGLTGGARDGGGGGGDGPPGQDAGDGASCKSGPTDNLNCGRCGHSCLGASCTGGKCEPFKIATNQDHPLGVFVAPDGSQNAQYVFWVNQMPHPSLRRADKTTGGGQTSLENPGDLGVDPYDLVADDNFIYWTEFSQSQIYKKSIVAGSKQGLWSPGGKAGFMAIDGSVLYATGLQGSLGIVANGQALYSGTYTVGGLAVNRNIVYWIEQEPRLIVSGLNQGGASPTTWAMTDVKPMGLAVDDDYLYWTENGVRIQRLSLKNVGTAETIYTASQPFGDTDLTVDGVSIFWTESQNGLVLRLAKP
jgi:hypothetical protein